MLGWFCEILWESIFDYAAPQHFGWCEFDYARKSSRRALCINICWWGQQWIQQPNDSWYIEHVWHKMFPTSPTVFEGWKASHHNPEYKCCSGYLQQQKNGCINHTKSYLPVQDFALFTEGRHHWHTLYKTIHQGDCDFSIPFLRVQFSVNAVFCLTIKKSQGQSLDKVAVLVSGPVFDHDQLYVALSQCTRLSNLRVGLYANQSIYLTTNVFCKKILDQWCSHNESTVQNIYCRYSCWPFLGSHFCPHISIVYYLLFSQIVFLMAIIGLQSLLVFCYVIAE